MFATLEAKVVAIGVLVVAILLGLAYVRHTGVEEQKAADAVAHTHDLEAVQAESTRRIAAQAKVTHDAQLQADASRADAASAAAARDAFRLQLAAYVAKARDAHPAASAAGAPVDGGDPIGVLADMLDRADARADVTERLADERGIRAGICERLYDSLNPQP